MVELNIDELTDEEIKFFIDAYIRMFKRVHEEIVEEMQEMEVNYGEKPQIISNLKLTPKAKLLFIAKKIAKNVLISKFTGIPSMYLDTDTSPIVKKGYDYYMQQDFISLMYSADKRLDEKTIEFLDILQSGDMELLRNILKKINTYYQEVYDIPYGSGTKYNNGDDRRYGTILASFLLEIGIINKDLAEMVVAVWKRGGAIGPTYDFDQEIRNVYEDFSQKKHSKGR